MGERIENGRGAVPKGHRGVGRAAAEDRPELRGRTGRAGRQPHLAEADAGEELAAGDAEVPVAGGGGTAGGGGGAERRRRGCGRSAPDAPGHGAHQVEDVFRWSVARARSYCFLFAECERGDWTRCE